MPIDWSDEIVLVDLPNEPELSEELSALFERLKIPGAGGAASAPLSPGADISRPRAAPPEAGDGGSTPHVVLNFSAVGYLNSSHLAAMLRLRKRILDAGRMLLLCGLSGDVQTLMRHTGLDRVFLFAPDTMTALARIQIADEARG